MIEKRFTIEKSSIVEDGFFICDNTGKFSFPTTKDKSDLIMYVKQLNELNNENEQLKQLLDYADDLIQSYMSVHNRDEWENIKKKINGDVE